MTTTKDKPAAAAIKDLLSQSPDGLREIITFLTGIAWASPLSSAQQPVDHVRHRGWDHHIHIGRSPPQPIIGRPVSPATGGLKIRARSPAKSCI